MLIQPSDVSVFLRLAVRCIEASSEWKTVMLKLVVVLDRLMGYVYAVTHVGTLCRPCMY